MPDVRLAIPIRDLSCGGGGALTLERALSKAVGVSSVYVNPATEIMIIDCDPDAIPVDVLLRKVRLAGFGTGIPQITHRYVPPRTMPGTPTDSPQGMAVTTR